VSHSHLALQHLLHKIDSAGARPKRMAPPPWLPEFVDLVAELFEPFLDVGRVGYECSPNTERWDISMFLGATEAVGGKIDGEIRAIAFQFDLLRLANLFEMIEAFRWNAFPNGNVDEEQETRSGERSFITVTGRHREYPIRLRIFCTPPADVAPGLRHFSDGSWEAV
jgi:hypothetical protein